MRKVETVIMGNGNVFCRFIDGETVIEKPIEKTYFQCVGGNIIHCWLMKADRLFNLLIAEEG